MRKTKFMPFKDQKLSTPVTTDAWIPTSILSTFSCTAKAFRNKFIRSMEIIWQIEEFWMIAKLLQNVDRFKWLGIDPPQQSFDLRVLNKKAVKRQLEI
jgi:hypothetical protein